MVNEWYESCLKNGYFLESRRFTAWATDRALYKEYCKFTQQGVTVDILTFIDFLKSKLKHKTFKSNTVSFKIINVKHHELVDVRHWLLGCLARGRIVDEWRAVLRPSAAYAAYLSDNPNCKPISFVMFNRYMSSIFTKAEGMYALGIDPGNVVIPQTCEIVEVDTFAAWLSFCQSSGRYLLNGTTPPRATANDLYQSYCAYVKGVLPITIAAWGTRMAEHFEKRRTGKGIIYQLYEPDPKTAVTIRPDLLDQILDRGDISATINEALEWYLKLC